ncbi:MAG: type IV pilin [Halapricum sp.]
MKLKQLFTDDDAVSPVIGVILMVAITVILAAVIATFVLGLGESVSSTAPQANFQEDFDASDEDDDDFETSPEDGILTVTHTGGDAVKAENLYLAGGIVSDRQAWSDVTTDDYNQGDNIRSGDSIRYAVNDDDTVRVIWSDDGEGNSAELSKWTGPSA